jgi:hypothetical protein
LDVHKAKLEIQLLHFQPPYLSLIYGHPLFTLALRVALLSSIRREDPTLGRIIMTFVIIS